MIQPEALTCQEVVELITDYLEHILLPSQTALFEAHMAGCVDCTTYLRQIERTIRLLHELRAAPVAAFTRDSLLQIFRSQTPSLP